MIILVVRDAPETKLIKFTENCEKYNMLIAVNEL